MNNNMWDNPNNYLMTTHPEFKKLAAQQWQDHLARRAEVDKKMAPARLKMWEIQNAGLPEDHPRKNIKPEKLLMGGDLV